MFAGLSIIRFHLEKKLNAENFPGFPRISFIFMTSWRNQLFYENVIATADDNMYDDRKTDHAL